MRRGYPEAAERSRCTTIPRTLARKRAKEKKEKGGASSYAAYLLDAIGGRPSGGQNERRKKKEEKREKSTDRSPYLSAQASVFMTFNFIPPREEIRR